MNSDKMTALPLMSAYPFGTAHGLEMEVDKIRNLEIEWERKTTSSVRRGYIIDLFENNGIWEEFKAKHWTYGDTPKGETLRRWYLRLKQEYDDYLAHRDGGGSDGPDEPEERPSDIAERDLREVLAKNLTCIEPGLRLYQSEGRSGVEYPIEGGFIDILAIDQSDRFVVVELKIASGRNKAIGQVLYYMGWVDENLGKKKAPCRGMIIAREIPDAMFLAAQRVQGLELYRYNLSVSVEPARRK